MGVGRRAACGASQGFNGAMAVRPWMVCRRMGSARMVGELQWGHGREAMDGRALDVDLAKAWLLQWGHGREAMDGCGRGRRRRARACFNGAMAVRPWMAWYSSMILSWGTCFNGVMAVRPWMVVAADKQNYANLASMGPWP